MFKTEPGGHLNWVERCSSDDLFAVMWIPSKLILNFPVETTYCRWNKTASLVSSMVTFKVEWLLLIDTKNRTSKASFTLRHFDALATRGSHSSAKEHPGILLSDVQTWRLTKTGSCCKFCSRWHNVSVKFRENLSLISLGETSPVKWTGNFDSLFPYISDILFLTLIYTYTWHKEWEIL